MSQLDEFINPDPPPQAEPLLPGSPAGKVLAWDFYNKVFQPNCEWNPGDRQYIWQGSIKSDIADAFEISTVYCSTIMRELYRMRCLVRLRKGGGKGGLTAIAVMHPPTDTLWSTEHISSTAATHTKSAADDQRFRDLTKRVEWLEDTVQALVRAAANQ